MTDQPGAGVLPRKPGSEGEGILNRRTPHKSPSGKRDRVCASVLESDRTVSLGHPELVPIGIEKLERRTQLSFFTRREIVTAYPGAVPPALRLSCVAPESDLTDISRHELLRLDHKPAATEDDDFGVGSSACSALGRVERGAGNHIRPADSARDRAGSALRRRGGRSGLRTAPSLRPLHGSKSARHRGPGSNPRPAGGGNR